ncbi:hypothetical protein ACF0H5_024065 [Mactra antiquata]
MSENFKLTVGICVSIFLLYGTECTVTVTHENGHFLCGNSTKLKCAIIPYEGGMTWKLDGTIIAQCAFNSCNPLGALPAGDNFTHDEANGIFYLDIGITHADNGTKYQCDDGSNQDQITVNIQVPPDNYSVTVTDTNLICTAGCFYPSTGGRMEVYCVTCDNEVQIGDTVALAPTTTGCTGDCAGPGIFTANGSHAIDNSSNCDKYRVYVYLDGFSSYNISTDIELKNCSLTTTPSATTTTVTTSTSAATAVSTTKKLYQSYIIIVVFCVILGPSII